MKKRILSLDGGGVRIVSTINTLVQLESEKGSPIAHQFDLIAGTSAGAIVAAMLTCPDDEGRVRYSALEVKNIFEEKKTAMFEKNPFWFFGIGGVKYRHQKLEGLLFDLFGDKSISIAITPVMITAYDTKSEKAMFFTKNKDVLFRHAARASAAAPTYFKPLHGFIDGGIFANNPAMCALVEGLKLWNCGILEIEMLSIGTGKAPVSYRNINKWGLFRWIIPLVDTLFVASSEIVHYQCTKLLGDAYTRINYAVMDSRLD